MNMNKKLLYLSCLLSASIVTAGAQNRAQKRVKVMNEQISKLMADRVVKQDIALDKIASFEDMMLEEEEELLFPADELYGTNWDTRWVNPFRADTGEVFFPDSCEIDCSSFVMPISKESEITSHYGPRWGRMHRGTDLKLLTGDTIYAAFAGKVRIKNTEYDGYGNYLVLRHPNGLETVYGHLSAWLVKANDIVRAGDPIALGGNTGRSTGSHLHFEIRFMGYAVNPVDIIDFENGTPHNDKVIFKRKVNGRNGNAYTVAPAIANPNRPAGMKAAAKTGAPPVYHRIKPEDTLASIANEYGTTVGKLCELNNITKTTVLRLGSSIRCL
ncbi:MAG: peptidoglycan DD-metalloendopeptidase [Bacteroidales bacterium]